MCAEDQDVHRWCRSASTHTQDHLLQLKRRKTVKHIVTLPRTQRYISGDALPRGAFAVIREVNSPLGDF